MKGEGFGLGRALTPSCSATERIAWLDWLRAIACLMVIMVHACECVYSNDYSFSFADSTSLWSVMLISGLMRPAVPLFLMASSFLLLPMDGSVSTFFKRRFKRVVIPFIVWLVLYAMLPAAWGEWDWSRSLDNLSTVWINFNPRGSHLWFIYMLLGVYLISPIISPWLKNVSRRQEEFYLIVWFITTFSWHLHEYVGDVAGECWWNPYPTFYYVSGTFGLVLLAHYIRTYVDWGVKKTLIVAIPCLLIGYAFCVGWFYYQSDVAEEVRILELSWQPSSFAPAIMSFGAFLLIRMIKLSKGTVYGVVRSISLMSYGIYLMHMMLLPAVFRMYSGFDMPIYVVILATAFTTYIVCYIITLAISRLPFGKYIVG
ncbi:MAG: acyltransferase family protein [Muribaculaceae bacterium]|nr:acyltransferase family protein [Muribaculaceae bacterium]